MVWWITAFNPEFDEPNCNDMVVIGSIDFVGRESMCEELRLSIKDNHKKVSDYFIFDENGHTVWIIWDKKEESVFEKFKDYVVNGVDIDGM